MPDLSIFTPGPSKYTHGISYHYNQTPTGRANRTAAIKRNKENQKALGAWHNESRGKATEVPMPKRKDS